MVQAIYQVICHDGYDDNEAGLYSTLILAQRACAKDANKGLVWTKKVSRWGQEVWVAMLDFKGRYQSRYEITRIVLDKDGLFED